MPTKIIIFILTMVLHYPLYAIKIQHNVSKTPDLSSETNKIQINVLKDRNESNNKNNHFLNNNKVIFNNSLIINEAFLIRPFHDNNKIHIGAKNNYIFKPAGCNVVFLDSYSKEISPDIRVLQLYSYPKERKIHAYVGRTHLQSRETYVTDLSGDGLINFKINPNFDDEEVTQCKKRIANLRQRKNQIYHKKSSEVYLSKQLDALMTNVISSKKVAAKHIIVDNNTIELVHTNGSQQQEIDEILNKKYTQEKHYSHALIFNDYSINSTIGAMSEILSIDGGWLLEAESWYKNTKQSILEGLIGSIYYKWMV